MSARPDEDDPTGVRRLLSGMSDPAPVSEELVRRISADIEDERRRSAVAARHRFDPAVASRRPRQLVLTAALTLAAGVVVVAGGVGVVAGIGRPATAPAHFTAFPPVAPPTSPVDPAPTSPSDGRVTVVASGTDYHRGDLDRQIHHLTDATSRSAGAGPTPTREDVDACLRSLALDGHDVVVDIASFERRPALVVVGEAAQDRSRTVAVMPSTCGSSDRTPLAGPYRLR